jgi:hypothetical protein
MQDKINNDSFRDYNNGVSPNTNKNWEERFNEKFTQPVRQTWLRRNGYREWAERLETDVDLEDVKDFIRQLLANKAEEIRKEKV